MKIHIMLFKHHVRAYESLNEMNHFGFNISHIDMSSFIQTNHIEPIKLKDSFAYEEEGFTEETEAYGEDYFEYILSKSESAMFLLRFK